MEGSRRRRRKASSPPPSTRHRCVADESTISSRPADRFVTGTTVVTAPPWSSTRQNTWPNSGPSPRRSAHRRSDELRPVAGFGTAGRGGRFSCSTRVRRSANWFAGERATGNVHARAPMVASMPCTRNAAAVTPAGGRTVSGSCGGHLFRKDRRGEHVVRSSAVTKPPRRTAPSAAG